MEVPTPMQEVEIMIVHCAFLFQESHVNTLFLFYTFVKLHPSHMSCFQLEGEVHWYS